MLQAKNLQLFLYCLLYLCNSSKNGRRQNKFRIVVSEVSYFVDSPVKLNRMFIILTFLIAFKSVIYKCRHETKESKNHMIVRTRKMWNRRKTTLKS